jgi:hypothetical protein
MNSLGEFNKEFDAKAWSLKIDPGKVVEQGAQKDADVTNSLKIQVFCNVVVRCFAMYLRIVWWEPTGPI